MHVVVAHGAPGPGGHRHDWTLLPRRAVLARLETFADRVRDRLDHLEWEERQQLIRLVVTRVEIDEEAATVVYRVPEGGLGSGGGGQTDPGAGSSGATDGDDGIHLRSRR